MAAPDFQVHRVPILDTGIGQEMGYANDAEFIAAAEAKREKALSMLTPEARKRFEDADAEIERQFLFGD